MISFLLGSFFGCAVGIVTMCFAVVAHNEDDDREP